MSATRSIISYKDLFQNPHNEIIQNMFAPLASAAPFLCVCNWKLWRRVVAPMTKQRRFASLRVIAGCYVSCIVVLIPYPPALPSLRKQTTPCAAIAFVR
jgi:hypothetical protein